MQVDPYRPRDEGAWNEFVRTSKNGTFLFDRRYMEYHADRYEDASLVMRDDRDRIRAVLPASVQGNVLVSHGGLTYGGFVSDATMTTRLMLQVLDEALGHLKAEGIERMVYKCVPHIYHALPAEEDAYALFVRNARLVRRDASSAIDTFALLPLQARRRRAQARAAAAGLQVEVSTQFDRFWPIVEANLAERHGLRPVHSAEEISELARRFPHNIALYCAMSGGHPLAGAVVYLSDRTCHVQYNAASVVGRQLGAQDLVLAAIVRRFATTHRFIDLGVSTEDAGRFLNEGLIGYKEGFGARTVVYDHYELTVP